jgi:hypothetical protein
MPSNQSSSLETPATRVLLKVAIYYVIVITAGALLWQLWPPMRLPNWGLAGSVLSSAGQGSPFGGAASTRPAEGGTLAPTVIVAMLGALVLSVPVAWMYLVTRAKRGYQQSVVQLLIILPLVVSGIVVLVKDSLPLAFSLAGIVAAVRFRNTLEDSKDAVYVFLATGLGLAAAVDLPVAAAISLIFNATVLVLWHTDFASAPVELEGRIAQKRLKRAKELARTGTFVAQIDSEVLKNMTRQQLEGVANKALRRARSADDEPEPETGTETRLRLRTRDLPATRTILEDQLEELAKEWRVELKKEEDGGIDVVDYVIQLKKKTHPDDLLTVVRAASGPELVDAELR